MSNAYVPMIRTEIPGVYRRGNRYIAQCGRYGRISASTLDEAAEIHDRYLARSKPDERIRQETRLAEITESAATDQLAGLIGRMGLDLDMLPERRPRPAAALKAVVLASEKCSHARVEWEQAIRDARNAGHTLQTIAAAADVSTTCVQRLTGGRRGAKRVYPTASQIDEIRRLNAEGVPQREIAQRVGFTQTTVGGYLRDPLRGQA